MRPWILLLALGCTPPENYSTNQPPDARITSHTNATTVFTHVETKFLGEATDPDQPNTSLTAHWSIEGTIGCRSAEILQEGGATRCNITLEETGIIAVSLEVIDLDGDTAIHDLLLNVVEGDEPGTTDLFLTDSHSYSALCGVDITVIDVVPGGNVLLDWCGLTTDDRDRPVDDATLISRIEIHEFPYVPSDLENLLAAGDLSLENATTTWIFYNGASLCSTPLSGFRDGMGLQFDPADPLTGIQGNGQTWMAFAQNNDTIPTFDPVASVFIIAGFTANLEAVIDDNTSDWGFDADLLSLDHIATIGGRDNYTLDWSAVTVDVLGNVFNPDVTNKLFIAKSSDNLVTLGPNILKLEQDADAFYRVNVGGKTDVDLMRAKSDDGTPFPGFTDDGLWLIGIECKTCMHPAPLVLTVIDVAAATQ